jgi:hypothetical protein
MRERLRATDIAQLDVEEFIVIELKGAASSLQFGRGPVWLLSLLPQCRKAVALAWKGFSPLSGYLCSSTSIQVKLRLADLTVETFSGRRRLCSGQPQEASLR